MKNILRQTFNEYTLCTVVSRLLTLEIWSCLTFEDFTPPPNPIAIYPTYLFWGFCLTLLACFSSSAAWWSWWDFQGAFWFGFRCALRFLGWGTAFYLRYFFQAPCQLGGLSSAWSAWLLLSSYQSLEWCCLASELGCTARLWCLEPCNLLVQDKVHKCG